MKKSLTQLLVASVLTIAAWSAYAQDFRVGFINTDRVFREANISKAATSRLEQEFGKRERDIAEMESRLKGASDKFEREAPTLPESQRSARQKQLIDQDRELQRKRREFQEDLNARKSEEMQQVFERANKTVKAIAESEKYDVILQEAVYINPKHDITDKVIKALNATK